MEFKNGEICFKGPKCKRLLSCHKLPLKPKQTKPILPAVDTKQQTRSEHTADLTLWRLIFTTKKFYRLKKTLSRGAVKRWKPSAGRTQPRGKGTYLCMARADTREVGFHFSMDGALVGFVLIHKNASYSAHFCAIRRKTADTTSGCKAEYIPYIFRNIYSVSLKASWVEARVKPPRLCCWFP